MLHQNHATLTHLLPGWLKTRSMNFSPFYHTTLWHHFSHPSCRKKHKTSYISPLLKKTGLNPESLQNYRPISNLPFISKVIELNSWFSTCKKTTYTTNFSQHTGKIIQCDCVVVLVLLDLTATFKTIDHVILMCNLSQTRGHRQCAWVVQIIFVQSPPSRSHRKWKITP